MSSEKKSVEIESDSTDKFSFPHLVAKDDPRKGSITNTISLFVDKNKQYIQYGLYTLGFFGLVKIGQSVRAFSRFSSASQIPAQFYKDRVNIYVKVKGSSIATYKSENVPELFVSHIPILEIPFNKQQSNISLIIPGVHVNDQYLDKSKILLNNQLQNEKLKVTLLESYLHLDGKNDHNSLAVGQKQSVVCEAYRLARFGRKKNVGPMIINEGFGVVSGNCNLMSDKYVKSLKNAENTAKKYKRGIWIQDLQDTKANSLQKIITFVKTFLGLKK